VVLLLFIGATAGFIHAQQASGELRLTVQDSSGAAMQVSGKLDARAFQTDTQGQYIFQNPPRAGRIHLPRRASGCPSNQEFRSYFAH
jgi:hypothetical protein